MFEFSYLIIYLGIMGIIYCSIKAYDSYCDYKRSMRMLSHGLGQYGSFLKGMLEGLEHE